MLRQKAGVAAALLWILGFLFLANVHPRALAASDAARSRDNVAVWVLDAALTGDMSPLEKGLGKPLSAAKLPQIVTGYPVLANETTVIALDADGGTFSIYTRRRGRITRRGKVRLDSEPGPAEFSLAADDEESGLTVTVSSRNHKLRHTVSLSVDGIVKIKQPPGRKVTVQSRIEYALVPSLVGTDLLYAPNDRPALSRFYVPSMNVLVGLIEGNDCMMVGVWPPGEQLASLDINERGGQRVIEAFSLGTAGRSFYLTFIDHPSIWHGELLRADYLEKDTAIQWRRPFEARWIGRCYIESEEYHFPFYFGREKMKLWGRCVRGSFHYPFWFDGRKTMVHFEKKFPPKGRLLVYYLETHKSSTDILSPVAVMEKALGRDEAAGLLDFDGVEEQVLLEHRKAVCAMTREIEGHFAAGNEVRQRAEVELYADDVAEFIKLIRLRVFQYGRFAVEMQQLLDARKKANPPLAGGIESIEGLLEEIGVIAKDDLPETSLEEVRGWTGAMKALAAEVRPDNAGKVKKYAQQCRSVAGAQDDLARDLSILAIRLMEEAADMGTQSPEHVRLAEQIITRTRAILRQPTWWEPWRKYLPKSDPGAP